MGFYEFRRQLNYKTALRGGTLIMADRWYPSSKLCSSCGYQVKTLDLGIRAWVCSTCQANHDRDVNAAINLKNLAVSSTVSACGEAGSGRACKRKVKPTPVKQESNSRKS